MTDDNTFYYFAYGTYMDPEVLMRCVGQESSLIASTSPAYLPGYTTACSAISREGPRLGLLNLHPVTEGNHRQRMLVALQQVRKRSGMIATATMVYAAWCTNYPSLCCLRCWTAFLVRALSMFPRHCLFLSYRLTSSLPWWGMMD